ncbi:hypothetical protein BKA70DRAFT_1521892 [Coprinopsis sp. MPI-PUGE-AT-0042]|nr:hypothetical protein BKA70DRAFT_1521892 [Coprinopsis sp. MPI-PUGE-AT-0042]
MTMACSTFHNHYAIVLTDGTTHFRTEDRGKTAADPSTHPLLQLSPPAPSLSTSGVHVATEAAGDDAPSAPYLPPAMTLTRLVKNFDPPAMPLANIAKCGPTIAFVLEQLEDRPNWGSTTAVGSDDDDKFGVVIVAAPKTLAMSHKTIETLTPYLVQENVGYVGRESHGARWDIAVLIKECPPSSRLLLSLLVLPSSVHMWPRVSETQQIAIRANL